MTQCESLFGSGAVISQYYGLYGLFVSQLVACAALSHPPDTWLEVLWPALGILRYT